MYNIFAITNRKLCDDLLDRIDKISKTDVKAIILREKDMTCGDYLYLSKKAVEICGKNNCLCILHSFVDIAEKINHKYIHMPMDGFRQNSDRLKSFSMAGASAHSVEEALEAERMGADYITASHIFATDCKKGLEPKGLGFLSDVCKAVNIPVYALGGINMSNIDSVIHAGADGACIMSGLMTCDDVKLYLSKR